MVAGCRFLLRQKLFRAGFLWHDVCRRFARRHRLPAHNPFRRVLGGRCRCGRHNDTLAALCLLAGLQDAVDTLDEHGQFINLGRVLRSDRLGCCVGGQHPLLIATRDKGHYEGTRRGL